ncbi:hypothetical protein CJ030_MR8G016820 [Morella rubra]|uniref:Uncharacterized protein n=1 Tax=Morella rubra TaxID=262757 RepID=A0A6A1UUI3_9ROSI|nr:hypothetical protein CJ030_MR8G016820 [Morella rubra]
MNTHVNCQDWLDTGYAPRNLTHTRQHENNSTKRHRKCRTGWSAVCGYPYGFKLREEDDNENEINGGGEIRASEEALADESKEQGNGIVKEGMEFKTMKEFTMKEFINLEWRPRRVEEGISRTLLGAFGMPLQCLARN